MEAAIKVITSGGRAPGHIQGMVNALRSACRAAVGKPGDLLDNMIRAQHGWPCSASSATGCSAT